MSIAIEADSLKDAPPVAREKTYGQILKSTTVIGGSALINVGFSILRTKALAVLLGPSGVGLFALYNSIVDLAMAVANVGVQSSGVRQIAESAGTGDQKRIAQTTIVLRRISIVLGLIGGVLLVLLAVPVSVGTFGDRTHVFGIALLGVAVFCRLVSNGQTALLQGMRRIADLARLNVLGAFLSTVISVPIVYIWGVAGIVPSIVAIAAASIATSWWYSRRITVVPVDMPARVMRQETAALLKLGLAFMASGILTIGSAYVIRLIVLKFDGIEGAGLYQAAWALGGLYAGFILQAMGTDFYPRLTAVHTDNPEMNRLVNEQAQVSMLLAGPGLIGTLTLAPLVISAFYSPEFHAAVDLLRWICFGMMLRIVAWPMGFIILAKGAQKTFFWTEVAATVVHVGLAALFVNFFGLSGSGAAFFGLYVWHTVLIYFLVGRMSGFRWSRANLLLIAIFIPAAVVVYAAFLALTFWQATIFGLVVTGITGVYALHALLTLMPVGKLPRVLQRLRPSQH